MNTIYNVHLQIDDNKAFNHDVTLESIKEFLNYMTEIDLIYKSLGLSIYQLVRISTSLSTVDYYICYKKKEASISV